MSTQAQESGKRSWWTEEDETLGPVARLVDWVRWDATLIEIPSWPADLPPTQGRQHAGAGLVIDTGTLTTI